MSNTVDFTILGSSAGMPQPNRTNSGYVLKCGDGLYQFDCGGGVSASFRRRGFDPLAVRRIIISHTHPDHISDLPLYIQMLYLAGRKEPVAIHLPSEALDSVRAYFKTLYLFEEKLPFRIEFVPVEENSVITDEGVNIHAIVNSHLAGYTDIIKKFGFANRMQCFSYLIHAGHKSIVYSADLGSEKDLGPFITDIDLLVVESTHIDIQSLLDQVHDYHVKRVVLTHIAQNFDAEGALTIAKKAGYNNLSIAEDGMTITLQ